MARGRTHPIDPSTHTVEMEQLAQLNERLDEGRVVSAGDLGLAGAPVHGQAAGLAAGATLSTVAWDGIPTFPYIHGVFGAGSGGRQVVDLHTAALRELSHRLGLHHAWGVGPGA